MGWLCTSVASSSQACSACSITEESNGFRQYVSTKEVSCRRLCGPSIWLGCRSCKVPDNACYIIDTMLRGPAGRFRQYLLDRMMPFPEVSLHAKHLVPLGGTAKEKAPEVDHRAGDLEIAMFPARL